MNSPSNGFKTGDVMHNGWAGESNCISIVSGTGSVRGTSCYKQRMLIDGKLIKHISYMDIRAERQTKIGHVDFNGYIEKEIAKLNLPQKEQL